MRFVPDGNDHADAGSRIVFGHWSMAQRPPLGSMALKGRLLLEAGFTARPRTLRCRAAARC